MSLLNKTLNRTLAANTLTKWKASAKNWNDANEQLYAEIANFANLESFFEYIVISKHAPLNCLPLEYQNNINFLRKLINKKYTLINEIYQLNYCTYIEILRGLDLEKFAKRCKVGVKQAIRNDIMQRIGKRDDVEDIIETLTPKPKKDSTPKKDTK